jgi:hypothetical protein
MLLERASRAVGINLFAFRRDTRASRAPHTWFVFGCAIAWDAQEWRNAPRHSERRLLKHSTPKRPTSRSLPPEARFLATKVPESGGGMIRGWRHR